MSTLNALIKKEFTEISRSRKLFILVVLMLFVAVASPIFAKLIPDLIKNAGSGITITIPTPSWHDAIDQFVKNIDQIFAFALVLIFAGSIVEEKNRKTFEILLTKPISRAQIILAKFSTGILSLLAVYTLGSIIFYYYSVSIFTTFSASNFCWLALISFIFLALILALTLFSSTITNNQIVAIVVAFCFEIFFSSIIGYLHWPERYKPGYALDHYKDLMAQGMSHDYLPSILVSLGLIIIFILLAIFIFNKQEIER